MNMMGMGEKNPEIYTSEKQGKIPFGCPPRL